MWHIWHYFHFLYIFLCNKQLTSHLQVIPRFVYSGCMVHNKPWNFQTTHWLPLKQSHSNPPKTAQKVQERLLVNQNSTLLQTPRSPQHPCNPTQAIPHKQTQSSSVPPRTEFGIEGSPSSWSWGHRPPAPAENHQDPRALPGSARKPCAKTQGKAWELQAPARQLHLPRCQDRWFSHRSSRGACPGSCRSWSTKPSLSQHCLCQEAGQQHGAHAPITPHYLRMEWMDSAANTTPVTWTPGYFGISGLVLLSGFETYYGVVILLHSYTYCYRVIDFMYYL